MLPKEIISFCLSSSMICYNTHNIIIVYMKWLTELFINASLITIIIKICIHKKLTCNLKILTQVKKLLSNEKQRNIFEVCYKNY